MFNRGPRGYRVATAHAFPRNSENFFLLVVDARHSSAADDCCGEVSRSNRGSFLVARSNAGGNLSLPQTQNG